MNCMNPFSYITTIHRGATDNGAYVGEFEMGISTIPGTVCLDDCQKKIHDVWTFTFRDNPRQHIRWELNNFSTGIFNVCPFPSLLRR
ncbi:hypothetical protein B0H10DRAFT_2030004 [Mycena sp. CBHHK59/15]|nr:hypothetical protein B0H10DRAFT_2030004 [Mycena sp. CBHHK59/15]